jgi:hypothetical protein
MPKPNLNFTRNLNGTIITMLGSTPSHIWSKCQKVSMACACMAVHEIASRMDRLLNILQASFVFPHLAYMSMKLLPTKISNSKPF